MLAFRKDLTYAAPDKDGTELWAGTFNLDPTATPKPLTFGTPVLK